MSAAAEIYATLIANTAVEALVGTKVFLLTPTQGPSVPFVIFQQIGSDPDRSHDGPSGAKHRFYQFACFAGSPEGAIDLRDAVIAALDSVPLPTAGNPTLQDERDSDYDDATRIYRADCDFLI